MIYCRCFREDRWVPDLYDLYDLYGMYDLSDLARVAGWELYDAHGLLGASFLTWICAEQIDPARFASSLRQVRSVLYRSCSFHIITAV